MSSDASSAGGGLPILDRVRLGMDSVGSSVAVARPPGLGLQGIEDGFRGQKDFYVLKKLIGTGGSSEIFLAERKEDSKEFAVKVFATKDGNKRKNIYSFINIYTFLITCLF
jgi:serine/threonine protein kinase